MALGLARFGRVRAELETAVMPGQVIQGHAKLESECKNCHVRFNRAAQSGQCLDCHKDVARDVAQRKGYHGRVSEKECRACHTEHKGRNAEIAPVDARTFDHRMTDFVLKGGHASPKVECRACHVPSKKYRETPPIATPVTRRTTSTRASSAGVRKLPRRDQLEADPFSITARPGFR